MILFYNLFLWLYRNGIRLVSLWNPKAKLWINGRRGVFRKLRTAKLSSETRTIWMHCASLGEYEQGKPVLMQLKEKFPAANLVVTFFSPSGYEIISRKKEFDNVFYLPMDSYFHARKWLNILKPDLVLWVKYEYWHYYLNEIRRRNIPLYLVSGVFRNNQVFFRWYGGFYRNMLRSFTHFFLQNESSEELLKTIVSSDKMTIAGDTRCDRVIQTVDNFAPVPGIADFCKDRQVVVAGSTWEEDEAVWIHYVKEHPNMRFIIAPHEIDAQNLAELKSDFPGAVFYSEWMAGNFNQPATNCLIIDNIGLLSRLYYYAHITYVGGGFGADGLHNILEPAVFGKPVLFGPYHFKAFEAGELISTSGAISIESAVQLEQVMDELTGDEAGRKMRGDAARKYIYQNAGASAKIVSYIETHF